MPYAQGRTYYDSDSHIMETVDWLHGHVDADKTDVIHPLNPKNAGTMALEAIAAAEQRRADADATAKLLEKPLISGPKGWGAFGASTPDERSKALDLLGFDQQLVFPTFSLGQFARSPDEDTVYAGASALNRGMASFCAGDRRMRAVGFVPLRNPERAVACLDEALKDGISAVWVPSDPPGDFSPAHVDLHPVWARLQEAKVPVVLHIGGGKLLPRPYHNNGLPKPTDFLGGGENLRGKDYPALCHSPQNFLTSMVLDGVFQKFEGLQCGVIELGATWVPTFMRMLDQAAHAFKRMEPTLRGLDLKPSEYIQRQVKFSLFPYEDVGWLIEQAGPELFMFASDYPHPEGGRDPIGSFEKRLDAADIGEPARDRFYEKNFAELMAL